MITKQESRVRGDGGENEREFRVEGRGVENGSGGGGRGRGRRRAEGEGIKDGVFFGEVTGADGGERGGGSIRAERVFNKILLLKEREESGKKGGEVRGANIKTIKREEGERDGVGLVG